MKDAEIKNLKTQIYLMNKIIDCDSMIIHSITNAAESILKKHIEPVMFIDEKQKTVDFKVKDFNEMRVSIARLTQRGLKELNNYIESSYLDPKEEAKKTLQILK